MNSNILQEQISYYTARANEYDEWFYRQGRYDRGLEFKQRWFEEVAILQQALQQVGLVDSVLELACGTGIWTQELLKVGKLITAVDASPEMIKINRYKFNYTNVEYRQLDLFSWQPDVKYDLVFFSFWLSHVPPNQLDAFLCKVYDSVKPLGQVFIIDSRYDVTSTANNHLLGDEKHIYQRRKLNDGQEFKIVKIFYERDFLLQKLTEFGFQASVKLTNNYFIYARGVKS